MSTAALVEQIIRVLSEMKSLFLITRSWGFENVKPFAPLPFTSNLYLSTSRTSLALPLADESVFLIVSGRSLMLKVDLTPTMQSPLLERVSSVVISSVVGCAHRIEG